MTDKLGKVNKRLTTLRDGDRGGATYLVRESSRTRKYKKSHKVALTMCMAPVAVCHCPVQNVVREEST